jgi:glutathione S-transferase
VLTIWGRRNSFNVQKVLWLIDEIGLEHTHVPAGGGFGGLSDPAFLARNPHGRIPVIQDGETIVWESHAILRYLAAKYAPAQFWPSEPAARSHIDRWMDWSQTELQPDFLTGVFWGFYRTPAAQRDERAVAEKIAASGKDFLLLDRWLETRAFLAGDMFSLADIPAGALLYRYFELEIERPNLPRVEQWYARLRERLAYRAHVMMPFDDLFGRLDY